jgi:hypothetical protein
MKVIILPGVNGNKGDTPFIYWTGYNEYLIDDDPETFGHTDNGTMPGEVSFTLDLGAPAILGRIVIHQRLGNWGTNPTIINGYLFNQGNPKHFTVYYSTATTTPTDDWDEWTKMSDYEVIKPSGAPQYGPVSIEDYLSVDGDEFRVPQDIGAVRFLRFLFHDNWANANYFHLGEVTPYGGYAE